MKLALLKLNKTMKKGFGVVEIMISTTIIAILGFSLIELGVVALWISQRTSDQTQAGFLLQEGAEAVRFLRDESWNNNISSLNNNTEYYLIWNGSEYELTTSEPQLVYDKFERTATFQAVNRNAQNNISEVGVVDPLTRKVTIEINWEERGNTVSRQVEFYITNLFDN